MWPGAIMDSEYEAQRARNIARNAEELHRLGLQGLIVGTTAFALALIGQLSVGPLARVLLSETLSIPVAVRAGGGGLPLWLLGVSLALSIGLATAGSVLPSTWMLLGMRGAAFKARV